MQEHYVLKHKLISTFITDKKISELERLRNKINSNSDSHSSASSTTSSSCSTSTSAAQSKVNTSRYKTELCRPFSEHGTCKYGEKCQFAHGQAELRSVTRHPKYKTDLCKTYWEIFKYHEIMKKMKIAHFLGQFSTRNVWKGQTKNISWGSAWKIEENVHLRFLIFQTSSQRFLPNMLGDFQISWNYKKYENCPFSRSIFHQKR